MGYPEYESIHNSTFDENLLNPETKHLWQYSSGSTSLSSIETSYKPTDIKEIVDSLVMAKYGSRYHRNCFKSAARRSRSQLSTFSTNSNSESTFKIADITSDYSVNTSDISDLISCERQSTTSGVETGGNVVSFSDTWTIDSTLTDQINSSSCEKEEETNGDQSADFMLELVTRKRMILLRTREQIVKAIYHQENQNRLTFYKERLEAEKLLLLTNLRLEHISCEAAEHTYLRSVNWFYSGNIEISNVHIFPNYYNNEHFLFLVISGSKVFATEGGKMKSNGGIYFSKKITIPYLQSDFKLHLLVYSVTSKALLKKSSTSRTFRNYDRDISSRKSSFSLWGHIRLKACQLSKSGYLKMYADSGMFTVCISAHANVDKNLSGFLNVRKISKGCPSWDRQFCSLNAGILNYYNYPPSDPLESTPARTINLKTCELRFPSREECTRRRSICLKMNGSEGVLMSFDTQQEFECWAKYLNIALSQIRACNKD